ASKFIQKFIHSYFLFLVLHSRRLAVIVFALLVAAAALAAMMLFRPEQRAKGVGEQRFYVRITHEGCAGNFQLYPDPLMKRNYLNVSCEEAKSGKWIERGMVNFFGYM
ncbi:MAG: hypothetical protein QXE92_03775, partial [Thermofilaceae archaeon]